MPSRRIASAGAGESVINFIETLFGVALVGAVSALIVRWRGNRRTALRLGLLAGANLTPAVLLELYVRYLE